MQQLSSRSSRIISGDWDVYSKLKDAVKSGKIILKFAPPGCLSPGNTYMLRLCMLRLVLAWREACPQPVTDHQVPAAFGLDSSPFPVSAQASKEFGVPMLQQDHKFADYVALSSVSGFSLAPPLS